MDKNTGGPAFPLNIREKDNGKDVVCQFGGMSLRDYFAAQALPAVIAAAFTQNISAKSGGKVTEEVMAEQAYHFADAMLAARGAADPVRAQMIDALKAVVAFYSYAESGPIAQAREALTAAGAA